MLYTAHTVPEGIAGDQIGDHAVAIRHREGGGTGQDLERGFSSVVCTLGFGPVHGAAPEAQGDLLVRKEIA